MGSDIILDAAALRANGNYQAAIDYIEANIERVDSDIRVNAYLEAFRAAVALRQNEKARDYAAKIAQKEPNLPSIQDWI